MPDEGSEKLVNAAANIGKYYTFLAQLLRRIFDPDAARQVEESALDEQLEQIRRQLTEILAHNPVVQENLAEVDREVMRIRKAASQPATQAEAVEAAKRYHLTVSDRARTVSDLVGLFRRM